MELQVIADAPYCELFMGLHTRRGTRFLGTPIPRCRQEAVPVAGTNVVFLQILADELNLYRTPATVGIGLRVVAKGVKVNEIFADRSECLVLLSPVFRKIGFPARGFADAFKCRGGKRVVLRLASADDVDDGSGGLSELRDVLGWNRTGVLGTVRKDDDRFASAKRS